MKISVWRGAIISGVRAAWPWKAGKDKAWWYETKRIASNDANWKGRQQCGQVNRMGEWATVYRKSCKQNNCSSSIINIIIIKWRIKSCWVGIKGGLGLEQRELIFTWSVYHTKKNKNKKERGHKSGRRQKDKVERKKVNPNSVGWSREKKTRCKGRERKGCMEEDKEGRRQVRRRKRMKSKQIEWDKAKKIRQGEKRKEKNNPARERKTEMVLGGWTSWEEDREKKLKEKSKQRKRERKKETCAGREGERQARKKQRKRMMKKRSQGRESGIKKSERKKTVSRERRLCRERKAMQREGRTWEKIKKEEKSKKCGWE